MGLLTDPSVGHGALTSIFVRHHNRFCILMYIASVVLFCMLAHDSFSSRKYLDSFINLLSHLSFNYLRSAPIF